MALISSLDFETEFEDLKRCYRAALKINDEHMVTIQSLEKDLGDRYFKETMVKDAVDCLYLQSLELSENFRQQHQNAAVKTSDVAKIFSDKLMNFQANYVRFCEGKVVDTKEAERMINSLEDEIHSLKSLIVENNMRRNQELEERKQLNDDLEDEVQLQLMEHRINTLADQQKSSKDDIKCNKVELFTHQADPLLEDIELLKICQENQNITIVDLEEKLLELKRDAIIKKGEIANMKLEIYRMKQKSISRIHGTPDSQLVQHRLMGGTALRSVDDDPHSSTDFDTLAN